MASAEQGNESDTAGLLTSVYNALVKEVDQAVFAIGGSVDIVPPSDTAIQQPLTLRWDSGEKSHGRSVSLPVNDDTSSQEAFEQLLESCQPATYGIGSKEVLDETYRKAGKLDPAKFSTSFSPHEHGLMDTISQALVHTSYRGLRAELYNLNVCLLV